MLFAAEQTPKSKAFFVVDYVTKIKLVPQIWMPDAGFLFRSIAFKFFVGFYGEKIDIFYGLLYGDISHTRYRVDGYKIGEKKKPRNH